MHTAVGTGQWTALRAAKLSLKYLPLFLPPNRIDLSFTQKFWYHIARIGNLDSATAESKFLINRTALGVAPHFSVQSTFPVCIFWRGSSRILIELMNVGPSLPGPGPSGDSFLI